MAEDELGGQSDRSNAHGGALFGTLTVRTSKARLLLLFLLRLMSLIHGVAYKRGTLDSALPSAPQTVLLECPAPTPPPPPAAPPGPTSSPRRRWRLQLPPHPARPTQGSGLPSACAAASGF